MGYDCSSVLRRSISRSGTPVPSHESPRTGDNASFGTCGDNDSKIVSRHDDCLSSQMSAVVALVDVRLAFTLPPSICATHVLSRVSPAAQHVGGWVTARAHLRA